MQLEPPESETTSSTEKLKLSAVNGCSKMIKVDHSPLQLNSNSIERRNSALHNNAPASSRYSLLISTDVVKMSAIKKN